MRTVLIILSVAVITSACRTHRLAGRIPPDAPSVVYTDCKREHDPEFSEREQSLIGVARRYVEQRRHRAVDAYYRVRFTFEGYEVILMPVSRYEGSQPVFGDHCTVLLREDGSIIRVFSGARG